MDYIKTVDPFDTKNMIKTVKEAAKYSVADDGGIAVIIARHACVIGFRKQALPEQIPVKVTDDCNECGFCHKRFECPALYEDKENEKTEINQALCAQCGVCLDICPQNAIVRA